MMTILKTELPAALSAVKVARDAYDRTAGRPVLKLPTVKVSSYVWGYDPSIATKAFSQYPMVIVVGSSRQSAANRNPDYGQAFPSTYDARVEVYAAHTAPATCLRMALRYAEAVQLVIAANRKIDVLVAGSTQLAEIDGPETNVQVGEAIDICRAPA